MDSETLDIIYDILTSLTVGSFMLGMIVGILLSGLTVFLTLVTSKEWWHYELRRKDR